MQPGEPSVALCDHPEGWDGRSGRRLGEEGSRSGREDGEGGTKEARLEGETAFHRPRPRIPSNEGLLRAMKLPPQTVCACACERD